MNQNVLDTKTKPCPGYTADELWFWTRVYSQYGSLWERVEDEIAMAMEQEIKSMLPDDDDVKSAVRALQSQRRPRIDSVELSGKNRAPSWFVRDHLGRGANANYWRTQDMFLTENAKRQAEYQRTLARLELARKKSVLSRTMAA